MSPSFFMALFVIIFYRSFHSWGHRRKFLGSLKRSENVQPLTNFNRWSQCELVFPGKTNYQSL